MGKTGIHQIITRVSLKAQLWQVPQERHTGLKENRTGLHVPGGAVSVSSNAAINLKHEG